MNLHSGARTCPASRALLIERITDQGHSVSAAASAAGISRRTAFKWLRRYREQGPAGLADRSSRPRRMPSATPAAWQALILELQNPAHLLFEHRRWRCRLDDGRRGGLGAAADHKKPGPQQAQKTQKAFFHRLKCRNVAFSRRSLTIFTPMPGPVGTSIVPSRAISISRSIRSGWK